MSRGCSTEWGGEQGDPSPSSMTRPAAPHQLLGHQSPPWLPGCPGLWPRRFPPGCSFLPPSTHGSGALTDGTAEPCGSFPLLNLPSRHQESQGHGRGEGAERKAGAFAGSPGGLLSGVRGPAPAPQALASRVRGHSWGRGAHVRTHSHSQLAHTRPLALVPTLALTLTLSHTFTRMFSYTYTLTPEAIGGEPCSGPPGVGDHLRPGAAAQCGGQSQGHGRCCVAGHPPAGPRPDCPSPGDPLPCQAGPCGPRMVSNLSPATHPQGSAARARLGPTGTSGPFPGTAAHWGPAPDPSPRSCSGGRAGPRPADSGCAAPAGLPFWVPVHHAWRAAPR